MSYDSKDSLGNQLAALNYTPPEIAALRDELCNHPKLQAECMAAEDFNECIAIIAAKCQIILDGEYTQNEILKLCDILVTKLKKESILIIPAGTGVLE